MAAGSWTSRLFCALKQGNEGSCHGTRAPHEIPRSRGCGRGVDGIVAFMEKHNKYTKSGGDRLGEGNLARRMARAVEWEAGWAHDGG